MSASAQALAASLTECMNEYSKKEDIDTGFAELRKILLHNRAEAAALDCLPEALVVRMLKMLAEVPRIQASRAIEAIKIIGVQRAAALAKNNQVLLTSLRSMFEGHLEAEKFNELLPDEAKALEVEEMQQRYNKHWPNLYARFKQGFASPDPEVVSALVLESVDYILTPIKAMDRTKYVSDVDSFGETITIVEEKPVIVLAGITGAGKTVTCNWLGGRPVEKVPNIDEDGDEDGTRVQVHDAFFAVGDDSLHSKTFAPNVKVFENFVLVDFPGTCDTSGVEIRIGMDLAFREMVSIIKPAHVLALLPAESFTVGKGSVAKQQISKMQRMLPTLGAPLGADHWADEQSASKWKIGVSKCDKDFTSKPKATFKAAMTCVTSFDAALAPHILNMNDHIFSGKASAPKDLIEILLCETRTPEHNGLAAWLATKVFGSSSGDIVSDCLNPNDAAAFGRVFMSEAFENAFIEADKAEVDKAKSFSSDASATIGEEMTWEAFSELIDQQVQVLCDYKNNIIADSQRLIDHGTLSLERRSHSIKELCAYKQCRLKLCFVEAEEKIMMSNLRNCIELKDELYKSALTLKTEGFMGEQDFKEVAEAYERSTQNMVQNARDLGFADTKALLDAVDAVARATAMAGGLVAGACSPMLAGAWAAGSTAALSTATFAGLSSGGLALVFGAVIVAVVKVARSAHTHGDKYSAQMRDKLLMSFVALEQANDAATKHKTALGAITSNLKSLEVPLKD